MSEDRRKAASTLARTRRDYQKRATNMLNAGNLIDARVSQAVVAALAYAEGERVDLTTEIEAFAAIIHREAHS